MAFPDFFFEAVVENERTRSGGDLRDAADDFLLVEDLIIVAVSRYYDEAGCSSQSLKVSVLQQ